jgi:hypothetical protein
MDNLFPINFDQNEYNPYLGVYQKWISGNPQQRIQYIYSMSAFQSYDSKFGFIIADYQKYAEYLLLSINSIITNTQDWYVRVYIDDSILNTNNKDHQFWIKIFNILITYPRVQVIAVKFPKYYIEKQKCHKELLAVMFRYLILFDTNVSVILFRDIDNIYTEQHQYFVDEWLKRGDEICLFMNDKYRRQEIHGLSPNGDILLKDKFYSSIFGGLWNIRKEMSMMFSITIWQKIFAYIEEYTKPINLKFIYGFDELSLSRVVIPIFLKMDYKIYSIPLRIYDVDFIKNMFLNPLITDFLLTVSDKCTIDKVYNTVINNYWTMTGPTAGLAQYMLCILSNIYFGIIIGKGKFSQNILLQNTIKSSIMPSILLMGIGIFTFKNHHIYNWYALPKTDTFNEKKSCGNLVVEKYLNTGELIIYEEWTAEIITVYEPPKPPFPAYLV